MPRIKHRDVLTAIRVAGYHGDIERGVLLYIKNWVSREAFFREFELGAAMRHNGMPCDCVECTKGETEGVAYGSPSRLPLDVKLTLESPTRTAQVLVRDHPAGIESRARRDSIS